MRNLTKVVLSNLALARSALYVVEALPVALVTRLLARRGYAPPSEAELKHMFELMRGLQAREAHHLAEGVYPLTALEFETPWSHLRGLANVLGDAGRLAWRMRHRRRADFTAEIHAESADLPKYYRRNFHYQTDGYLSEASARRYDHQVDILFRGTTGAMRRSILPTLRAHARPDGRFLDLGAGTGSSTRGVLATFPKARVTALDLSAPYLKVAQERLRRFPRVDFAQGDATALPFKDETFDAVFSVYVLHELPRVERENLVREAYRVLKPGGIMILADSIQIGDDPRLDDSFDRFPQTYHEPFYAGYVRDPLEGLVARVTGREVERDLALVTKSVWCVKPE